MQRAVVNVESNAEAIAEYRRAVNRDPAARKRRRVRALQRYALNPPMKVLTWLGLVPGHVLIETRGRCTGRRRVTVGGMHVEGETGWIVAEHGDHAGYVRNLQADPAVRVRIARRWHPARAKVVPGDDSHARLDSFGSRSHARAVRRFGTSLATIRVGLLRPANQSETTSP